MAQNELKQKGASVLQEIEGQPSHQNKDDVYLARMGKRPVLQVCTPFCVKSEWSLILYRETSD